MRSAPPSESGRPEKNFPGQRWANAVWLKNVAQKRDAARSAPGY
jgi:hypothetical protein